MGKIYYETGFSLGTGNDWLGYSILASVFVLSLVGLVYGFKGEKSSLKYISIVGNSLALLTIGLLSIALIVYDFVPQ